MHFPFKRIRVRRPPPISIFFLIPFHCFNSLTQIRRWFIICIYHFYLKPIYCSMITCFSIEHAYLTYVSSHLSILQIRDNGKNTTSFWNTFSSRMISLCNLYILFCLWTHNRFIWETFLALYLCFDPQRKT